jgi:AcrR family transcriptional regulator
MGRGKKICDRTRVAEAAVSLIEEEGYEAFSTRRLASVLHISTMTLYNYYENKEAILGEAYARGIEIYGEELSTRIAGGSTAGARALCAQICAQLFDFALERPNLYRFLFDSRARAFREGSVALVGAALAGLGAGGRDRTFAAALRDAALLYETLISGLALDILARREGMTRERYEELAALAYERLVAPLVGRSGG